MKYTVLSLFVFYSLFSCQSTEEQRPQSFLVIVLDGLRPDYVTPELMPNLHALGEEGIVFENHHSVYPTVTRVNSSSIATGMYPARHGVLGNSIYLPEVDSFKSLNTGDATIMMRADSLTNGRLLLAPTMGEILESNGMELLVVSSGSTGSAYLLNNKAKGRGMLNTDLILPGGIKDSILAVLGPIPPDASPNLERNARAVDAYFSFALAGTPPAVTFMWLSDPDHTAHGEGIGSEKGNESLRGVDGEIGRIREKLRELHLQEVVNIIVTSDHGFSTHAGGADLKGLLQALGMTAETVTADGAIHVKNREEGSIRKIVDTLQSVPWAGAIFTRATGEGSMEGQFPGTLSFESVHWKNDRSADILVSANWTADTNEKGYKGTTNQGGTAGHGTTSPYDIHNTLLAIGPSFKKRLRVPAPTANVDIAPTLCYLLGITPPEIMDGRVIKEALLKGNVDSPPVTQNIHTVASGTYQLELHESVVDGHRYIDFTEVKRVK